MIRWVSCVGVGEVAYAPGFPAVSPSSKLKGTGAASPGCTSILVKVHRSGALTRGGRAGLEAPQRQAQRRSRSVSAVAACMPSGPRVLNALADDGAPVEIGARSRSPRPARETPRLCAAPPALRGRSPSGSPPPRPACTVRWSCRSSVCFITSWYSPAVGLRPQGPCTAGPLPRFSIRYWMQAVSAALAISPPRASSSRTR